MHYVKNSIQPKKILRQLETIQQSDRNSQYNKYAIRFELYETKHEGFRYFQLFCVLFSIMLLFCFLSIPSLIFVCLLNGGITLFTPSIDPPKPMTFKEDKALNEDLFAILRNKLLPTSIPSSGRSRLFQSMLAKSQVLKQQPKLDDHFSGQVNINNKLVGYDFATFRTNSKSFPYGTVLMVDNPKISCEGIVVQKSTSNAVPKHLKGNKIVDIKAVNPSFSKRHKVFSQNEKEATILMNNSFVDSLVELYKNIHPNLKWTQIDNKIIAIIPKKIINHPSSNTFYGQDEIEYYGKQLEDNLNDCFRIIDRLHQQVQRISKETINEFRGLKITKPTKKEQVEAKEDIEKDFYKHLILK